LITADYQGSGWEDSNPSVFKMTIVKSLKGEYQIKNGYGPEKASQVMQVRILHVAPIGLTLRYAS
jgi:hypothetical protein